jgi:hypothetical protein
VLDGEALEVDYILSGLDTGATAKTALIIKTKNDAGVGSYGHPLIIPPINGSSVESSLVGKVLSVSINQSKLLKKYLTPVGSSPTTPVENSLTPVDISTLGLKLEQLMYYKNTTSRPCIVVNVQRDYDWMVIEGDPPITIVLITGFDGKPLNEVMAEEEFKRVMPITPTPAQLGTAMPINTTPEWIPHPKRKIPSYVLCIPLKVYPQNLRRFEESVRLDALNLEKLKLYILGLGGISANADYVDLEEDRDDDYYLEAPYEDIVRFVDWDEIVV